VKRLFLVILLSINTVNTIFAQEQLLPDYLPTDGLVGWWPFNGNADDESINGNQGAVHGARGTIDRFDNPNKAYSFDGIYDYITVDILNSSLQLKNDFTISVWTYLNYNPNNETYILSKGDDSSNEFSIVCHKDNTLSFAEEGKKHKSSIPFNFYNTWTHITCVVDKGISKIYINGKLMSMTPLNRVILPSILPLTFGATFEIGTNTPIRNSYLLGKLDDIAIWNRALTQEEINGLYKAEF